jgi:hypothetical protein
VKRPKGGGLRRGQMVRAEVKRVKRPKGEGSYEEAKG